MNLQQPIFVQEPDAVYETLETSSQGLRDEVAAERLRQQGFNELPEPARRSLWMRFADQLTHFMALLLWVAGTLAFVSRTPELGWAIWAVIWVNASFSFWQEYQAERALGALKKVLPLQAKVYRDGVLKSVSARELVVGDVLQLEEGDRISADARIVEAESCYVDVSVLTGESLPVLRHARPVQASGFIPASENNGNHASLASTAVGEAPRHAKIQPAELANLLCAGSTVAAGRAKAVVYATGARTEFGHVAHLTASVRRETSTLEIHIARIVRVVTLIAVGMGVAVFLLSYLLIGMNVTESFIFGVGIIVANVPEGLLPTVTLALAIGVQRMARRNALVRRLSAVETLSATDVICTDKTGTLTKNEMTVRALWVSCDQNLFQVSGEGYDPTSGKVCLPEDLGAREHVHLLLAGAALCSNARLVHLTQPSRWQEVGDPTEAALLVAALKAELQPEKLQIELPRLREVPFDSWRRMMTVVLDWRHSKIWAGKDPNLSLTKGAPLEVLRRCQAILSHGKVLELNSSMRSDVSVACDGLAREGFRVLGLAARRGDVELLNQSSQDLESRLTFIGLVAMFDPPRPEVTEAISKCHGAGIAVTMVTGDYNVTAEAIARRTGLARTKTKTYTGEDMTRLSRAQLSQILTSGADLVFARMSPEHKLQLVQAYKDAGFVVTVTGDGVNDAPALRAGHIGIAMGLNGTDVARESADIVLLDDNFATIVNAIELGRSVYQNIRKFITYILASNVPEIFPFLWMVALKIPPALNILQILAVDLGTDMVPALGLGADPPEAGIMLRPPRPKNTPLLNMSLMGRAYVFLGVLEGLAAMLGFFLVWWGHGMSLADLQRATPAIMSGRADPTLLDVYRQSTTVTLAVIVACQIGNLFACRTEFASVFTLKWFNNRLLWFGIAVELGLLLSIVYLPALSNIFQTSPPVFWQLYLLPICPPLMIAAEELRKWLMRSLFKRK